MERLSAILISYLVQLEILLLRRRLRKAGVPNVDYIPTWTSRSELRALYNLAVTLPQGAVAVEIGSYLGASTCYLASGLAQIAGHLFCVDTWENETMPEGLRDTYAEFQENTKGVRAHITPIRKKSSELTFADIRQPVNMVFIDGDHSYAAVKSDFECIQSWITKEGIVAFHDFGNPDYEGVTRVVGEALASGQWMLAGMEARLAWIKRAKWTTPPWVAND